MGPDRGVPLSAAIQGHMPPTFWGVALVPAFFSRSARGGGGVVVDNNNGMSQINECGVATPWAGIVSPPPLSLWQKIGGHLWHEKPLNLASPGAPSRGVLIYIACDIHGPSYRDRKPGCPVRRTLVNLNPFH